jgi:hypothetical protein
MSVTKCLVTWRGPILIIKLDKKLLIVGDKKGTFHLLNNSVVHSRVTFVKPGPWTREK